MIRRKGLRSIALAGALMLGLVACSNGDGDSEEPETPTADNGEEASAEGDDGENGEAGGLITIIVNDPSNP